MPNISVDDVVVDETQSYADFIVRLDAPNTGTVTVHYATSTSTAIGNVDYTHLGGDLTFASGEMVKTVRIAITNDVTPEVLEHFHLYLSSPSANAKLADEFAFGHIVDNEGATGIPAASLTDAVVNETDHTITVTLVLNKPSTGNVSFTIVGQDATATANSDVRAVTALGKIAFAPGEMAKTVTFGLLRDGGAESAEVFDVVLSSPVGATIADGRSHIIIAPNGGATVAVP
ncbi:MAG: Calx-beta domain-containing protein, partial [Nitrospira sp.]